MGSCQHLLAPFSNVNVALSIHIHVCVYIYTFTGICRYMYLVYIYIYTCLGIYIYMHTRVYMHIYRYTHICINVYMYVKNTKNANLRWRTTPSTRKPLVDPPPPRAYAGRVKSFIQRNARPTRPLKSSLQLKSLVQRNQQLSSDTFCGHFHVGPSC